MPVHTVERGDCLSSIAARYGFADWRMVYNRPENAEFRSRRPDPNVIQPGDRIFIPAVRSKTAEIPTGSATRIVVKEGRSWLVIQLRDSSGKPVTHAEYRLTVAQPVATVATGHSDAEGKIRCEIGAHTTQAMLRLREYGVEWSLEIGGLDPLGGEDTSLAAASQRLTNLGYDCGDGTDAAVAGAIREFQTRVVRSAQPSGRLDRSTIDALIREHGR